MVVSVWIPDTPFQNIKAFLSPVHVYTQSGGESGLVPLYTPPKVYLAVKVNEENVAVEKLEGCLSNIR